MGSGAAAMTRPELAAWPPSDPRYRRFEVTATIGAGDAAWRRAAADVLRWRVKTRSGFAVTPDDPVEPGDRLVIAARVLGLAVREPVEVVAVVREPERVGFAYRTLPGHPVDGEEAFVVSRVRDEARLTIRSLTRPAPAGPWRTLYPVLRLAQVVARRRYLRALR